MNQHLCTALFEISYSFNCFFLFFSSYIIASNTTLFNRGYWFDELTTLSLSAPILAKKNNHSIFYTLIVTFSHGFTAMVDGKLSQTINHWCKNWKMYDDGITFQPDYSTQVTCGLVRPIRHYSPRQRFCTL